MKDTICKSGKIGVFDSGLGGLSVLREIHSILPNEDLLYFGDSLNAPYGIKSKEEVYQLSKVICENLIEKGCKAIVIACNTATSAAVERLRTLYDIPIIGMEPAIKPALEHTTQKVLVMATEMTLKEEKFEKLMHEIVGSERILKWPAPSLVTLVENDYQNDKKVSEVIASCFLALDEVPEAIVLGCTHFIFLKEQISHYFNDRVQIFDGNKGTVLHLKRQLEVYDLINDKASEGSVTITNSLGKAFIEKSKILLDYLSK